MMFHNKYMVRCLELAKNGLGYVAPNPLVGCVIVYEDIIIGEGYHHQYGSPHAEVNAIYSVADKNLLKKSTLYVNLEPCCHWGKTPPCTDLIIKMRIPNVVIGCQDIFAEVNGKGIEQLRNAGINVETGVLEKESLELNKRFFSFHKNKRPYIILKWAQTADGFIAREDYSSKWITNEYSRLLVHNWRSEEAAILVGTNTAFFDNPQLSSRDMKTKNPVRIVIDKGGKLPGSLHLFNKSIATIVFTEHKQESDTNLTYVEIDFNSSDLIQNILNYLYKEKIQSLIVEGGSKLLQSFIGQDLWDEARIFKNDKIFFDKGIKAPVLNSVSSENFDVNGDNLYFYYANPI